MNTVDAGAVADLWQRACPVYCAGGAALAVIRPALRPVRERVSRLEHPDALGEVLTYVPQIDETRFGCNENGQSVNDRPRTPPAGVVFPQEPGVRMPCPWLRHTVGVTGTAAGHEDGYGRVPTATRTPAPSAMLWPPPGATRYSSTRSPEGHTLALRSRTHGRRYRINGPLYAAEPESASADAPRGTGRFRQLFIPAIACAGDVGG